MLILTLMVRSSLFLTSLPMRTAHLFMSNASGAEPPTIPTLLERSQRLRKKLYSHDSLPSFFAESSKLAHPSSSYMMGPDPRSKVTHTVPRGFCNWLLPNVIMIGQYPGMTPESNGPTQKECNLHIENMMRSANISLFCCLQSEVPCQSDADRWESDEVYLDPHYRREFPRPFTRYSTIAQRSTDRQLTFIYNPIEDLNVPTCNNSLLNLLSQLIQHLEDDKDSNSAIYIHCWGGRGRAGLIGSCLLSLLFPELSYNQVLYHVQNAYNTRAGAEQMPSGLRSSPQTEQQRLFVKEFVCLVQKNE